MIVGIDIGGHHTAGARTQGLAATDIPLPVVIHDNTGDAAITGAARLFDADFRDAVQSRLPSR